MTSLALVLCPHLFSGLASVANPLRWRLLGRFSLRSSDDTVLWSHSEAGCRMCHYPNPKYGLFGKFSIIYAKFLMF